MTAPRDVNAIWSLVERAARVGVDALAEEERGALTWLRNTLGTARPLESYAPRTRRRYKAASVRGETAREVNSKEYVKRKNKPDTTIQRRKSERQQAMELIARRNRYLPHSPVDIEEIEDYVSAFGWDNVISLLKDQLNSCEWWLKHDARPGNRRWKERRWTDPERVRDDFSEYISNTDIMYYYHAVRS